MSLLRLFMNKDFSFSHKNDAEPFFFKGEEVRIGKINSKLTEFMIVCAKDDRHAWAPMDQYNELIDDRLV